MDNIHETMGLLVDFILSDNDDEKACIKEELRARVCGQNHVEDNTHLEHIVESLFRDIGLACNLTGHDFAVCAVCMLVRSDNPHVSITKELYPYVAKQFHTTTARVERNIRTAIDAVYAHCAVGVLSKYFGIVSNRHESGLTNGQFLFSVAKEVRRRWKSE